MLFTGTIVVASVALLSGVAAAIAAPGADENAGTQIITPHAFASGNYLQTGRSATTDGANGIDDKYRFSVDFTSPCDSPRIQSLFCRDAD